MFNITLRTVFFQERRKISICLEYQVQESEKEWRREKKSEEERRRVKESKTEWSRVKERERDKMNICWEFNSVERESTVERKVKVPLTLVLLHEK